MLLLSTLKITLIVLINRQLDGNQNKTSFISTLTHFWLGKSLIVLLMTKPRQKLIFSNVLASKKKTLFRTTSEPKEKSVGLQ